MFYIVQPYTTAPDRLPSASPSASTASASQATRSDARRGRGAPASDARPLISTPTRAPRARRGFGGQFFRGPSGARTRGGNLEPEEIVRVVQSPSLRSVLHRRPVLADDSEQNRARLELALDDCDEVVTGRDVIRNDVIGIFENAVTPEPGAKMLQERTDDVSAVLAPIADEDSRRSRTFRFGHARMPLPPAAGSLMRGRGAAAGAAPPLLSAESTRAFGQVNRVARAALARVRLGPADRAADAVGANRGKARGLADGRDARAGREITRLEIPPRRRWIAGRIRAHFGGVIGRVSIT